MYQIDANSSASIVFGVQDLYDYETNDRLATSLLFLWLVRSVSFVLAQRFVRAVDHFAAIAHSHFFDVAIAVAVECSFKLRNRVIAVPLRNLTTECAYKPALGSTEPGA